MKPAAFLRSFLTIAGSAALTIADTRATTPYWDVDGSGGAGFGTVVGTRNTTNNFWNTDVAGSAGGSMFNTTTSADDLIIKQSTTNTGNISVTGTQNASSITFAANVGPTATITGGTAIVIGNFFFPASGPAGSFNGLHPESKFLGSGFVRLLVIPTS